MLHGFDQRDLALVLPEHRHLNTNGLVDADALSVLHDKLADHRAAGQPLQTQSDDAGPTVFQAIRDDHRQSS